MLWFSMKPGRNDPCHCGSGKKYKKCHLDSDESGAAMSRSRLAEKPCGPPVASLDYESARGLLRQIAKRGSAEGRNEFSELLSTTEPLLEYIAHREEIEAAETELKAHRGQFDKLCADGERFQALTASVFAEECFAPFRFTAEEVQRAFDHTGYPGMMAPDEQTTEILRAAILRVADEERRAILSMGLLSRLPEFVAAGRYLEGCLLQSCALQTAEEDNESNPFLFHMFSYGYDAWVDAKRAKNESLLRELGINPDGFKGMSLEELDSWFNAEASDPIRAAKMEAFFQKHPHLREESVANFEAMKRNAPKLFEREDSRCLLLPNEQVHPWVALFNERFSQSAFASEAKDGIASKESARKLFEELALPLMRQMADSIFTPEGLRQLVADLRRYQNERFAAGDKTTAQHAMGAIAYLEREDSPGQNVFLLSLCWKSLDSAIHAVTAQTVGAAD